MLPGGLKFGLLKILNISARNCTFTDSRMRKFLNSEKSRVIEFRTPQNPVAGIAVVAEVRESVHLTGDHLEIVRVEPFVHQSDAKARRCRCDRAGQGC